MGVYLSAPVVVQAHETRSGMPGRRGGKGASIVFSNWDLCDSRVGIRARGPLILTFSEWDTSDSYAIQC